MKTSYDFKRLFLCLFMLFIFIETSTAQLVLLFEKHGYEPGHEDFGKSVFGLGDQNGDGYDDIAITGESMNEPQWIQIYYGGNPMDTFPDFEIMESPGLNIYANAAINIGDIIVDGKDDIGTRESFTPNYNRFLIFNVGSEPDSIPDFILPSTSFSDERISEWGASGDVNGDGYDDFILSSTDFNGHAGKVCLFYGGALLDTIPDWTIVGSEPNENMGYALSGGGDLNGDGYDDFLVVHFSEYPQKEALIFFGGDPPDTIPDVYISESNSIIVDDLNGDNFADIVCKSVEDSHAVYFGSPGMDNIPDVWLHFLSFAISLSNYECAGDINHDGYADIITGMPPGAGYGIVTVHFGSWDMDGDPDITFVGGSSIQNVGDAVGKSGDTNGDGIDDIMWGTASIYGVRIYAGDSAWAVSVEEPPEEPIPTDFTEIRAYPNPFNSTVQLEIILKGGNEVDVSIYNLTGRLVKRLYSSYRSSGDYLNLTWDGVDEEDCWVSSGIYFVSVKGKQTSLTKKIVMIY